MTVAVAPKRRAKYNARRTEIDGIVFDSKSEANRYQQLKGLQSLGMIADLSLQPKYDLHVNGIKIGFYKADFLYLDVETGKQIIEDVKGMKTPMYNWKKRHMKAEYGIEIHEV